MHAQVSIEIFGGERVAKKRSLVLPPRNVFLVLVSIASGAIAITSALMLLILVLAGENFLTITSCPGDPLLPLYLAGAVVLAIILLLLLWDMWYFSKVSISHCLMENLHISLWIPFLFYVFWSTAGCIWVFVKHADFFLNMYQSLRLPDSYCSKFILVNVPLNVGAFLVSVALGCVACALLKISSLDSRRWKVL